MPPIIKLIKKILNIVRNRLGKDRQTSNTSLSREVRIGRKALVSNSTLGGNVFIGANSNISDSDLEEYCTIYDNVTVSNARIGAFSYVAPNTKIANAIIGKYVSIAQDCKIGMGMHPSKQFVSTHPIFFSTRKQAQITFADKDYFDECPPIEIGNDVWIAANAVILNGVKIQDGAIVGAGAVVVKNVEPYSIVGGVPAHLIRYRFSEKEIKYLMKYKWWNKSINWLRDNYKKFHDIKTFINDLESLGFKCE